MPIGKLGKPVDGEPTRDFSAEGATDACISADDTAEVKGADTGFGEGACSGGSFGMTGSILAGTADWGTGGAGEGVVAVNKLADGSGLGATTVATGSSTLPGNGAGCTAAD